MFSLEGKVALVTGASRGIGRAIALALAEQGADVAVTSLSEWDALQGVAVAIRELGRRSYAARADAADYARAREVVQEITAELGGIDILVNNAGAGQPKTVLELTEAEWDRTIGLNLKSCFNYSQAALPGMLARGWGRIINISSMSAKNGGGGPPVAVSRGAYATTKAGMLGFTKGLALEAGPKVTVNAVCPGPILTRPTTALMSGEAGKEYARRIPAGRVGVPEDIAAAVVFLASAEASFVTGEEVDVNGGFHLD